MHERDRAQGLVGCKVGVQPCDLLRARLAIHPQTVGDAVGIQRHEVPAADIKAVPALAALSRLPGLDAHAIPVVEVTGAVSFVVPDGRIRDRSERAPNGVIKVHEVAVSGIEDQIS